jgi:sugar lactone lactonase YvrE
MAQLLILIIMIQFITILQTGFAGSSAVIQTRSLSIQRARIIVIHQFPKGTYVENIAIRSNGKILVVLLSAPEVWEINPSTSPATLRLVYRFNDFTRVTGIIETRPDVFAVITGKPALDLIGGSWALWQMEMTSNTVRKIVAKVNGAGLLNGLTNLNDRAVLVSDTAKGVIYRFDLGTGAQEIVQKSLGFGLNGIRTKGNILYYSNTLKSGINEVAIDTKTGKATGKARVFGSDMGIGSDDFALSSAGDLAYVCNQFSHELIKVDLISETAKSVAIAGSKKSGLLLGPTSAVFGRTANTSNTIYVTTAGKSMSLQLTTPKDAGKGGGKVVAVYI